MYSRLLVCLSLAGILVSGCAARQSELQIASSGDCRKIAFVMSKGPSSDIYVVCPDGSGLRNLTNDSFPDSQPSWSPDGTRIAFASARTGTNQVYVMDADGANVTPLTHDYANDFPLWLPGGREIAVRSTDGVGLWWWRILSRETGKLSQYSERSHDFFFQTPAWSPDGHHLAYMSLVEQRQRNDGSSQIHVSDLQGNRDVALTHDSWANIDPVWSPDGTKIAFFSERDGKYNAFALYVMGVDGSNLARLTEPVYPEGIVPSWSPDGQQIAVASDQSVGKLYVVDLKARGSRELLPLSPGEWASQPSWQP